MMNFWILLKKRKNSWEFFPFLRCHNSRSVKNSHFCPELFSPKFCSCHCIFFQQTSPVHQKRFLIYSCAHEIMGYLRQPKIGIKLHIKPYCMSNTEQLVLGFFGIFEKHVGWSQLRDWTGHWDWIKLYGWIGLWTMNWLNWTLGLKKRPNQNWLVLTYTGATNAS